MKKQIILSGAVALMAITSCTQTTTEKTETTTEKTTIVRDSVAPDGTTIKMNKDGVVIENKDGSKENNVSISKDSASIQISDPK